MKRIMTTLIITAIIAVFIALSLNGCSLLNGNTIEVKFTLKNSTDYEIESIEYFKPPRWGSSNPNTDILNSKDETLKPGEEREFSIWLYRDQLSSGGMLLRVAGMEDTFMDNSDNDISFEGAKGFEITCDDNIDINFKFTVVGE